MTGSYVYFIRPIGMDGPIKIGCSVDPRKRLEQLMSWSPFLLEVAAMVPGGFDLEKNIHECFTDAYSHREWFRPTPRLVEALSAIIAGTPVAEAIDLGARLGRLPSKSKGAAAWSAETRRYMSLHTRARHAAARASRTTGEDRRWFPVGIDEAMHALRFGEPLTVEQMSSVDRMIQEPERHFLTYHEKYPSHRPAAPSETTGQAA